MSSATLQQKSKFSQNLISSTTSIHPPTESVIEAAKIDYASRLYIHTQQQLQKVYSDDKNNNSVRNSRGDKDVKKSHNKKNW